MATQSQAAIQHQQKMTQAMQTLEINGQINREKIQEWALLDIATTLHGIQIQLTMLAAEISRAAAKMK